MSTHLRLLALAARAEAAGRALGLPAEDLRALRWAALMHDLGELAVPVATWLRPGPLSTRERDAAELHGYHGERAALALGRAGETIAGLILRHHERLDGSGYHRRVGAADLSAAARVLAAAEAFQTAQEDRPHRPALTAEAAAARLRAETRAGRLCPDAVEAVLASAGQASRRAPPRPLLVPPRLRADRPPRDSSRALSCPPPATSPSSRVSHSSSGCCFSTPRASSASRTMTPRAP